MNIAPAGPQLPPINRRNHAMTRFILRRLERNLDVRIHTDGFSGQFTGGGGIIVANHFTRLETFVIPFVLHREACLTVRVLAAPMFFTNKRFGEYLLSIGALPTNHPNKYELIARDILHGGWWLIFPEGSMVKDRKVIERGRWQVSNDTGTLRRPPHSGAAIIALLVQRYKDALRRALRHEEELARLGHALGLSAASRGDMEAIAQRPTSIVPLNVTYYPLNPQDNLLKSFAARLAPMLLQSDLRERLLEELTVEGSMLLKGVDIAICLGQPLLVEAGLQPRHGWRAVPWSASPWRWALELLQTWGPVQRYSDFLDRWSALHGRRQRRRVWQMTQGYMRAIYRLTTVNMDHLLSTLILLWLRTYQCGDVPVAELQRRVYVAVQLLCAQPTLHLHADLRDPHLQIRLLTPQEHPGLASFAQRAVTNRLLTCVDNTWRLAVERLTSHWPFGVVRLQNFMQVCYNEMEPLTEVMQATHHAVRIDLDRQRARFAQDLCTYEQQLYDTDYATFASVGLPKIPPQPPGMGRPVLLRGVGEAGTVGVLLIHGYSASPAEVLPLAYYLHAHGLTVYVVRLRGHGTSPYDLQIRQWQDWYDSVVRGYSCLRALSDVQFAGGMSTGGALALYLAAQQVGPLQGVFAVGAPIKLHYRLLRFAPVVQAVRGFIRADPENPHANYVYHPLQALRQLTRFIEVYQEAVPHVTLPVLLVQARRDPTVRPESAQYIYDRLQSQDKTLLWKDIDRHVIVGAGYPEVHADIFSFLAQHSPLPALQGRRKL
jgi:esterase/lipase/1-acyl-sn-glycerol-3-phosphate acyltransferase